MSIKIAEQERIGRYRVLGWLGAGGMGEVLAGHDEKLDRPVAIKRLRGDLVATEERRRRLEIEAQLTARLSHPNVVQVYDFVSANGLDHIVAEYVDGQSLAELYGTERPSLERALEILIAISRGLEAAHARGIVHRDLKLENVLVGRDGVAKIADFGIAAHGPTDDDLHAFGVLARELVAGLPETPRKLATLIERLRSPAPGSARDAERELEAMAAQLEKPASAESIRFRQVAALSLQAPSLAGDIEQVAGRIAEFRKRIRDVAARYQAHLLWPSALEALICVGYPRVYGDNCAAAANLVAELAETRISAGIDVGKIAVLDQPDGPVLAGSPIDGATAASRRAPAGSVYVTPAAQRILAHSFRLAPVGDAVLYRLDEPLDWEARGAMVSSPLVGRQDVLARIREAEARAFGSGADRITLIVGPPGSGKSRLVRAFLTETTAARTVFVRGTEAGRATPFAAFTRLLQDLPEAREAVTEPEMRAVVAHVAGFATAADEALLASAAPYERHSFVADLLARFLVDVLAADPCLLVVEDVYWLDTSSRDVLHALAAQARGRRLCVLATSRPALRNVPEDLFSRHDLGPLAPSEGAKLADAAAGGWVLPPRVARAIVERAGGIPLVIEELTQFVAARAVMDASGTHAIDLARIPTTFADAILERFQDLGARTRRILQLAASIGNELDETLLVAVADVRLDELRSHIDLLSREGLLHATGFGERHTYAFRHALTRDAIYDAQDTATRIESHRAILAKIDEMFPSWESERPALVARQCEGAGDLERAVRAWTAAGARAVAQWSAALACQHYESALHVLMRATGMEWASPAEHEIRTAYAPVLGTVTGWASDRVNANHARIRALASQSQVPLDWSTTFLTLAEDYAACRVDDLSAKLGLLSAEFDESSPVAGLNRYLLESMRGVVGVHAGYLVRARGELERALGLRAAALPILKTLPVPEPMLIPRMFLAWVELLEGNLEAMWTWQTTEEGEFEPATPPYLSALSWGAVLGMVTHDWKEARWRAESVAKSEIVGEQHIALCQMDVTLLDLRERSAREPLPLSEVERLVTTAWQCFTRWRGEHMRICVPLYLSILTEAVLDAARNLGDSDAGRFARERARAYVDEMLALAAEENILDRYFISEVFRIQAALCELDGRPEEARRARLESKKRARLVDAARGRSRFLEERA